MWQHLHTNDDDDDDVQQITMTCDNAKHLECLYNILAHQFLVLTYHNKSTSTLYKTIH